MNCVLNENYREVRISEHLFDLYPIYNDLKQGDALSPPLFKLALEYAIKRMQENKAGLDFNEALQIPVYADELKFIKYNINIINKNAEALLDASRDVRVEVNGEKIRIAYVHVSLTDCRANSLN